MIVVSGSITKIAVKFPVQNEGRVWRRGSRVVDRVQYGDEIGDESVLKSKKVQLPDEFAGHVMVFRTFDRMSYGLVMTSIKPSKVGYDLKHPDATY